MGDVRPEDGRITTVRIIPKGDGSVEYEGDDISAIAEAVEAFTHARSQHERRAVAWGKIGSESMTRLAKSFPSLRHAPGVEPWNVDKFLPWATSGVLSHGEVLAAKFVLSVWNPGTDWEDVAREGGLLDEGQRFRRFDLFEAMNVWDSAHVRAALTWLESPFFP